MVNLTPEIIAIPEEKLVALKRQLMVSLPIHEDPVNGHYNFDEFTVQDYIIFNKIKHVNLILRQRKGYPLIYNDEDIQKLNNVIKDNGSYLVEEANDVIN